MTKSIQAADTEEEKRTGRGSDIDRTQDKETRTGRGSDFDRTQRIRGQAEDQTLKGLRG